MPRWRWRVEDRTAARATVGESGPALERPATLRELRSFGLIVGVILALIGLWPRILGVGSARDSVLVIGVALVLLALAVPSLLRWPYRAWMALGHALGWVVSRVVLGVLFVFIFTPLGFLRRRLGGDPMRRSFELERDSYLEPVDASHRTDFTKQF